MLFFKKFQIFTSIAIFFIQLYGRFEICEKKYTNRSTFN